jgi:hypothetical protein
MLRTKPNPNPDLSESVMGFIDPLTRVAYPMPAVERAPGAYMSNEMLSALQALRENSEATRVFEELKRSSGTCSGWELARALGANPEKLEQTLRKLKDARVINSNGQGLDGIYFLTDLAFKLRLIQAA